MSLTLRRINWWIMGGLCAGAVVVAVVAADRLAPSAVTGTASGAGSGFVAANQPAPGWDLPALAGGSLSPPLSLAAFAGRPVVLNFWASWCVPCRKETPALEATSREPAFRSISFVGIDTSDQPSTGSAFAGRYGVSYPLASDPSGGVARRYGVYGMPTTVFISAAGRVVGREVGGLDTKTLTALLTRLFLHP